MEDLLFKDWDLVKNNCHKTKLIKFIKIQVILTLNIINQWHPT